VTIIGTEMFKLQARLAGADIPPRRRKSKGDEYGEMLERRHQMREWAEEFEPTLKDIVDKPLRPIAFEGQDS
jgi:hypothetical protein